MSDLKFVTPMVKVINSNDNRMLPWFISRDDTVAKDVSVLNKTDFGLHDFYTVAVLFENASAGFREVLTGCRPYAAWSQSSRADFIHDLPVAEYMPLPSEFQRSKYEEMYAKAETETKQFHQDVGRMNLPLGHARSFSYQASLRHIIKIAKSLHELMPVYYYTYMEPLFNQLNMTFDQVMGSPFKPIHTMVQIDRDAWEPTNVEVNGMKIVSAELQWAHRAQLVRQSKMTIKDDLFNILRDCNKDPYAFESIQLKDTVKTTIIMSVAEYEELAKYRSCLLFQVSFWYPFLESEWKKNGVNALPCKGCKDKCIIPFEAEDASKGKFSTYPCFVWNESKWFYEEMKEYLGHDHPELLILKEYANDLPIYNPDTDQGGINTHKPKSKVNLTYLDAYGIKS